MTHKQAEIEYAEAQAAFFERLAMTSTGARQRKFIKSVEHFRKHIQLLKEIEAKEMRAKK